MRASPESIHQRIARTKRIIRVWNTSASLAQACKSLGMKTHALTTIIASWRVRGVKLKLFGHSTRQPELDWKAMDRYARSFLK